MSVDCELENFRILRKVRTEYCHASDSLVCERTVCRDSYVLDFVVTVVVKRIHKQRENVAFAQIPLDILAVCNVVEELLHFGEAHITALFNHLSDDLTLTLCSSVVVAYAVSYSCIAECLVTVEEICSGFLDKVLT